MIVITFDEWIRAALMDWCQDCIGGHMPGAGIGDKRAAEAMYRRLDTAECEGAICTLGMGPTHWLWVVRRCHDLIDESRERIAGEDTTLKVRIEEGYTADALADFIDTIRGHVRPFAGAEAC